jgi:hypothetical protein
VTTEPTPIQNEIARQIHVQKPAHLVPGRDVGMLLIPPLDGREAIAVHVLTDDTKAIVCYDAGRDTYVVSRQKFDESEPRKFDDIYVDQLGEMIFGSDATEFTGPFVEIWTEGDDGEWTKVASI